MGMHKAVKPQFGGGMRRFSCEEDNIYENIESELCFFTSQVRGQNCWWCELCVKVVVSKALDVLLKMCLFQLFAVMFQEIKTNCVFLNFLPITVMFLGASEHHKVLAGQSASQTGGGASQHSLPGGTANQYAVILFF